MLHDDDDDDKDDKDDDDDSDSNDDDDSDGNDDELQWQSLSHEGPNFPFGHSTLLVVSTCLMRTSSRYSISGIFLRCSLPDCHDDKV